MWIELTSDDTWFLVNVDHVCFVKGKSDGKAVVALSNGEKLIVDERYADVIGLLTVAIREQGDDG